MDTTGQRAAPPPPSSGTERQARRMDPPTRAGIYRALPHDSPLFTALCGAALTALLVVLLRWHLGG